MLGEIDKRVPVSHVACAACGCCMYCGCAPALALYYLTCLPIGCCYDYQLPLIGCQGSYDYNGDDWLVNHASCHPCQVCGLAMKYGTKCYDDSAVASADLSMTLLPATAPRQIEMPKTTLR